MEILTQVPSPAVSHHCNAQHHCHPAHPCRLLCSYHTLPPRSPLRLPLYPACRPHHQTCGAHMLPNPLCAWAAQPCCLRHSHHLVNAPPATLSSKDMGCPNKAHCGSVRAFLGGVSKHQPRQVLAVQIRRHLRSCHPFCLPPGALFPAHPSHLNGAQCMRAHTFLRAKGF
jgi:hypothetical protein